ncbi:MAG: hypothetical protein RLZZ44_1802 [Bacteroidota bacterium]|jgi:UDP-N-acetylglucosamine 2-epimerase (non-hydrolysing)
MKVAIVFGTRPEAIKVAPIIGAMNKSVDFTAFVIDSGQHPDLTNSVINLFDMKVDRTLDVFEHGQPLNIAISKLIAEFGNVFELEKPSLVIVQGDTSTTLAAALAAFNLHIPVAHIEAGLRTTDKYSPFPEELNRRLVTQISDVHFPATKFAREVLIREGINSNMIEVVGNTVIDAALQISCRIDRGEFPKSQIPKAFLKKPFIFVTLHRRESWGIPIKNICKALLDISTKHQIDILLPMHPNPLVRREIQGILGFSDRVNLVEPLNYVDTIKVLKLCKLVATDSGGLQEESPTFNKPVVVLRKLTERMEGIQAGCSVIAGTEYESIVQTLSLILTNEDVYEKMSSSVSPYGNGEASLKIVEFLKKYLMAS